MDADPIPQSDFSIQYVAVMVNMDCSGQIGVSTDGPFSSHVEAVAYAEWRRSLGHCQWAGFDTLGAPGNYTIAKWQEAQSAAV